MKKNLIIIVFFTLISSLFGFFREIVLSYYYGASYVSDAFIITLLVPGVFIGLIGRGIKSSYVPIYTDIKRKSNENAERFMSNIVNILALFSMTLMLFVFFFPEFVLLIVASGFQGESFDIAIKFLRISSPSIIFTLMVVLFTSYLQVKNKFFISSMIGLPFNIAILLFIVLSNNHGINLLPVGVLLGYFFQFILLYITSKKSGFKLSLKINLKDKNLKQMTFLAFPVLLGSSVTQINKIIDKTLASNIIEGGISALQYANTLNLFIMNIFILAVSKVTFPRTSEMAAIKDIDGIKKMLRSSLTLILLLIIPATLGYMVFSEEIVRFLYGRGAFDDQAIYLTSSALVFYSLGMLGVGFREILSNAFYSLKDSKTPVYNATLAVALNIVLNFILAYYMGLKGLALATSIAGLTSSYLLYRSLNKKIGDIGNKYVFSTFLKILISSLLMVFLVKTFYGLSMEYLNENLSLVLVIILGVIIYSISLLFAKIPEVDQMLNTVLSKLKIK